MDAFAVSVAHSAVIMAAIRVLSIPLTETITKIASFASYMSVKDWRGESN